MAFPGTIKFPELAATPSVPPAGTALIYMKTDNVLYILDSGGVETPIGTASGITELTSDVTATGPGIVPATVHFVGGSAAVNIHTAELLANAATASNTPSTIVFRDASGNFVANIITANLSGNATTATTAGNFTGSLSGDVTGTQSATVVGHVGGKTSAEVSQSVTDTQNATNSNTASTIVKRDASGNFAANIITSNVTGNVSGSSGSFTGSLSGDVTGTQSATTVAFVGTSSAANVHSAELLANAATSANTASTIVKRDASGNFVANIITANLSGNATTATTAGNFTGSLSGDVTGTQSATSISDSIVTGKILTGYISSPGIVSASDSILIAIEKLNGNIANISNNAIDALTGDVSATGPGSVAAVVNTVGGSSATNIHSAELAANAATPSNTASTIVKRNASGDFSAGTITAALNGNASTSTNFTGSLSGDVTGTQSATTVAFVGTSSAANVHSAELLANAATSSNTASTIVKRNASGNFSAGIITANLTGNVTGNVSGSAASFTGNLLGDVSGGQSSTSVDKIKGIDVSSTAPTDTQILVYNSTSTKYAPVTISSDVSITHLGIATVNSIGGSTAANVHSAELAANAATDVDTFSTIVKRDASGNFAANIITANLSGNATTATTAGNFTGSLSGDVTGTQGATTVAFVGTSSAANVHSAELLANAATSANTASTIVKRDGSGNFSAGTITANLTGNVNGVDPAAHESRHLPSGADAITTAAPLVNLDSTTTNAVGTANSLARSDHSHAISTGIVSTLTPDQSNSAGSSANLAKADHIHNIPSGTPVQVGTSNFAGAAASFSLSDHVHNHGAQTNGTLHAAVTSSVNGFMIAADKVKLDASTSSNTASTLVLRDASGNFSAGTITANLTGTATNFTGSLSGDVTGTQSATLIATGAVTDTKASLSNKPACTVAATSNQALTGIPTIDGQVLADGSLALLTAQSSGSENGPWVVHVGAWIRPTWYPSGGTTQAFQFITSLIRLGTIYQGSTWRMTTSGAITIDTTATTWVVTPHAINSNTVTGTLPAAQLPALTGDVTSSAGSNVTTVASVGGSTAANVHSAELLANAATSANTASTIVKRDGSGNFSAGTITAALIGNVTGNTSGSSGSFTGSLSGDVSGTQGATVLATVATPGTNTKVTYNAKGLVTSGVSAVLASADFANQGTTSTVLHGNAGGNPSFGAVVLTSEVSGVLPVANGGTNSSTALNNKRIMVSSGGAIVEAAALTDGQLLIGSTGNAPAAATLTAGTGITITNAAGSITVANAGAFTTITKSANYTILSTDSIIFCDTSGGAFTLTLPNPSTLAGKIYRVIDTTGNFQTNNLTLARNASEKIEGIAASKVFQTAWGWFNITTNGTDWFCGG